jgi:hypothetical protein
MARRVGHPVIFEETFIYEGNIAIDEPGRPTYLVSPA